MSSAVGPRPPLVTIRSTPSVGEEAQLRLDVLGPVAADRDVRQLDAELQQAVGDSQGPLRSRTRPVSTSVPVTTMPARTAAAIRRRDARPSGQRAGPSGGVNSKPTGSGLGRSATALPLTVNSHRRLAEVDAQRAAAERLRLLEDALEAHVRAGAGVDADVGRLAGRDRAAPRSRRRLGAVCALACAWSAWRGRLGARRRGRPRRRRRRPSARARSGRRAPPPRPPAATMPGRGPPAGRAGAVRGPREPRRAERLQLLELVAALVVAAVLVDQPVRVEAEQLGVRAQEGLDEGRARAASRTPRSRAPAGTWRGSSSAPRRRRCRGAGASGPRAAFPRSWAWRRVLPCGIHARASMAAAPSGA